jgi:hypothetical protein
MEACMKKAMLVLVIILIAGIALSSCTTFATKIGTPQKTIPVLSMVPTINQPEGTLLGNYFQFLGICIGYKDFLANVEGKEYDVIVKSYLVVNEIIAISK